MHSPDEAEAGGAGTRGPDPLGALVPGPRASIGGTGSGPLAGISFVAKDVFDVAGTITGAGNPDWAAGQEPASSSADAVSALLAGGAKLVGKGQCAELAFSLSGGNVHYGMPRNTAAPEHDPGGSTSGPAAAVAGGLCELGLGTDTLGSTRVPASYCGLYGFRPTHGAISTTGALPLAQRFDTVGVLAREARVLRTAAEVLLGARVGEHDVPPKRLLLADDALAAVDPDVAQATRTAGEELAGELGATLESTGERWGDGPDLAAAMAAFGVLQGIEVWRNFGAWVEAAQPSFGDDVSARIERASGFGPADGADAEPVAAAVADLVGGLRADEALVLPAAGAVAPRRNADGEERESARQAAGRLTCIASLAGAPSVSLPLARVDGLPAGVGLIGPPGADRALLAAALQGSPSG